jgi:hypothetical protein
MHRQEHEDDLLTAREVAAILSKNAGREISRNYVRVLASPRYKKLTPVHIDGRTNLYRRGEAEAIRIAKRPGRRKKEQ